MIISGYEVNADVNRAAAEAHAALAAGDTDRARSRFNDAGRLLEAKIANYRKQPDKHLTRFLAASHYFQGGYYQKALQLAQRIEVRFLPAEARPLYGTFFREVKERSKAGYERGIREAMFQHWVRKDYEAILRTLQEHPYLLREAETAFLRANCYEGLRDYQAAAVFHADALKKGPPGEPGLIFSSAAVPLTLAGAGDLPEAWKCVEHQLIEIPHAVTLITASLLRFHQSAKATGQDEKRHLLDEQIRYFREAWERYQQLPDKVQRNQEMKDFMALCLEAAAIGLNRVGDAARAREICDTAIELTPQSYAPRTVRGTITYPSQQAKEDFREAIRLGEESYYPFYFLAHASLLAGDHAGAASWARQALVHRPSRRIGAQLYNWLAISRAQLGAGGEEVLGLLHQAQRLDPDNPEIGHNVQMLETSITEAMTMRARELAHAQVVPELDDYMARQELRIGQRMTAADPGQYGLVPAET